MASARLWGGQFDAGDGHLLPADGLVQAKVAMGRYAPIIPSTSKTPVGGQHRFQLQIFRQGGAR